MKRFIIFIILIFSHLYASAITWDITDQDCDTFDGNWANTTVGTAISSLGTEDGRTVYNLTAGLYPGNYTYVNNIACTWTSNITIEVVAKRGMTNNTYPLSMYFRDSARKQGVFANGMFPGAEFPFNRLGRWNGSVYFYKRGYSDVSNADFHTYRIVVKDDNITAWVDGLLFYHGLGPIETMTGFTANTIGIQCNEGTIYIDHIRASSTPEEPTTICPLKINGEDIVSHIAQVGDFGGYGVENCTKVDALRYRKTNCSFADNLTYGIPLVKTTDAQASKVRVYNGTEILALMKAPTF